ncbi:hypothetical protein KP509_29G012300 [Ceratopteris richardii]|uniref:Galactose oxidase n=1 Tax=Ceratopteris richardii TaxID=49495 RepID=A0A8T2R4N8_CERRI|nr:hypothetical protein KP509_29G012300 [Ceratopteris richardii]
MGRLSACTPAPPILALLLALSLAEILGVAAQGSWELLLENAGIASMHTALTHYGNVVLLDRTDIGPSQINLTGGVCRDDPNDLTLKVDCTAHSVVFDPADNSVRTLFIQTDTWCSSGQFMADGTLVQTGGDFDGLSKVRTFSPCSSSGSCDWVESTSETLQDGRWYASNQLLPDGTQIVVGGRGVATYEFIPANGAAKVYLPFLSATNDAQTDNLYPFVHLLPDGNLYIFANRDSIVLNYKSNTVVKTFPTIPGEPRNYPSAGSSVMLPLTASDGYSKVEVLVCGGAQYGCFLNSSTFPTASETCGRIAVTDENPSWDMQTMPSPRAMGDMLLLPTGHVLIINGAENGCQGWNNQKNANLKPVIYSPAAATFATQSATTIARVYHSTAILLPDGRVLVAGSNPHQFYELTGEFPTELRIEAFSPDYLNTANDGVRPMIVDAPGEVGYNQSFTVTIAVTNKPSGEVMLAMLSSPFTTHSFSQGLRLVNVEVGMPTDAGNGEYTIVARSPPSSTLAPPSYYMLFAVNEGISGPAVWMKISY